MTSDKFSNAAHEMILKRIRDIPSLPEVVNKMIQLLGEANTPASQIAELISYDPGLTSKVLRMVNSAAYGFQRQISSIQHGIMILGFNTVRGLVLSASIFKMFEEQAGTVKQGQLHLRKGLDHYAFWKHCLGTAMAARLIGKSLQGKDPRFADVDDAFSAGMLHDIGKVVMDVYMAKEYTSVVFMAQRKKLFCHGLAFLSVERELMGTDHTQIGAYLALKWKLPVGISEVIEYHHQPSKAENCQPLVYLVALANQIALVLYEYQGIYHKEAFSEDVLSYFEFSDDELQQFIELLKVDMDSAEELLSSISSQANTA